MQSRQDSNEHKITSYNVAFYYLLIIGMQQFKRAVIYYRQQTKRKENAYSRLIIDKTRGWCETDIYGQISESSPLLIELKLTSISGISSCV